MDKLFSNVALGWIGRRILDWGGWIGTVATFLFGLYVSLPASTQDAIMRVFQNEWQDVTLGSLAPLVVLIFSQVMSWRATTKPQIVTEDGKKADPRLLSANKQTMVEEVAETAIEKKAERPNPFAEFFKRAFGK